MSGLQKLFEALDKQGLVFEEFLQRAEAKKEVLVRGDLPALEEITQKEQALFMEARRLEDQRLAALEETAVTYGLEATGLTVAKLLKVVSAQEKEALEKSVAGIQLLVRDIQEANKVNASLIKQSLDFIDFSVNLLTSLGEDSTYGENNKKQRALLLDRKI